MNSSRMVSVNMVIIEISEYYTEIKSLSSRIKFLIDLDEARHELLSLNTRFQNAGAMIDCFLADNGTTWR